MDQASKLREIARSYGKGSDGNLFGPRIIAITSGKGGVGKTSVVVNLALQLGRMGKKVVILDADFGLSNTEILLGTAPPYSMCDVFAGEKTIEEIAVKVFGISFIPGGSDFQEMANLDKGHMERLLTELKGFIKDYDFFFIDTGVGISKNVLGFLAASQEVIVVSTPDPTSVTDAYCMIKLLSNFRMHSTVNIIINRVLNMAQAQQTRKKIDTVTSKFLHIGIRHLGYIFEDDCVAKAVKNREPFVINAPYCSGACDIYRIACELSQSQVEGERINGMDRMISKLIKLFG